MVHTRSRHRKIDQPPADTTILQEEIKKLRLDNLRMKGKELDGLSLKELQGLENQLFEGLISVKNKKEQLLAEQLERSRLQEEKAIIENETLRKQLEDMENKRKAEIPNTSLHSGSSPGRRKYKALRIRASNCNS